MKTLIRKALQNPFQGLSVCCQLGKGYYYRILFKLTGMRVKIGKDFRVKGSLYNIGPGKIIIGDNVRVRDRVSPYTAHKDAVLEIGNRCFLTGTRFGCAKHIIVKEGARLADCRILDTNFHGEKPHERGEDNDPKEVIIGKNAWIAMNAIILKGSTIGENSIVGPNSVVMGANVLPDKIYVGNPARAVKSL